MAKKDKQISHIQCEMENLKLTIKEHEEDIFSKDHLILSLQNSNEEKCELLRNELKTRQNIEEILKKTVNAKNMEISSVEKEMETVKGELESEICCLRVELEKQKEINEIKNQEMEKYQDGLLVHEALKLKIEELMNILETKNMEIDELKYKNESQEVIASRNDILQKEILILKVSLQQKDLDIKSLNNLLEVKEEIISENKSSFEEHGMEVHPLNEGNQTKNKNEIEEITKAEKEDIIINFEERIRNEEDINKKSQTEIINLKVENDKIKEELRNAIENAEVISKDDKVRMIKSKEEEIEKLKKEILREQHIVAHVQVTQEKEIIEKEKEISILNKILTQERQVLLEKERQIDKLLISKYQVKFSSCQTILNMKTFIIIL